MAAPGIAGDVGVLLPPPHVLKVGGEELRLQALPVKRLLAVVQYIQDNADLLDKMGTVFDGDKVNLVGFLEGEVYKRLNGLLRLLYDKATAEKMTDEWCGEHLSNAHYAVILRAAMKQNQLEWFFQKAGEFLGAQFGDFLRKAVAETPLGQAKPG